MTVHMRRGMEQLYRPGDKEVIRHIARGGSMAFRTLLVVVSFALMYGCEQASSPVEQQEKQAGMEEAKPEEPTPQRMEEEKPKEPAPQPKEPAQPVVVGNIPIAAIVGENVKGSSFDLRVLDYFRADHYYYAIDRNFEERCTRGVCHVTEDPPYIDIAEEATSQEGKFVVVNYSVTNTSSQKTSEPVLSAQLHVKGADGKTQVYKQTDDVTPPHNLEDIPPLHGLRLAQFIFDVPKEVEPELLAVAEEAEEATVSEEVGVVDLRESDPQGPRPEEILALQYEYFNMADYERAYDLYAQESKDRVSEQVFVSMQKAAWQEGGVGFIIPSYSFPTVEKYEYFASDLATIQVVLYTDAEGEGQHHAHRVEAVLDDEGWRIVMEDDQYIHARCWENLGRLC